jgi:TRAP-type uncharacterized transport system substrate-binding protein
MIELEKIHLLIRKIYENASAIKVLQIELEDMLGAIDKNNLEFTKGIISKGTYKSNERKLKKESVSLIKRINNNVDSSLNLIQLIKNELKSPKNSVDK